MLPIPANIDAPNFSDEATHRFVMGWFWLQERHHDFSAVEAWLDEIFLGETTTLYARPDVNTALNLPVEVLTGFLISPGNHRVAPRTNANVRIAVRLRDGTRVEGIATRQLKHRPAAEDPLAFLQEHASSGQIGLEIGAHEQPVPMVAPFYTDRVKLYAGTVGRADFLSDARYLPVPDGALDFLCSSHVLEHLPNPRGALHEWHRVLRPGGILYLIVPDKRYTFDEPRTLTPASHLLKDALFDPVRSSRQHIDEFVFHTDWARLKPDCPPDKKVATQGQIAADYLRATAAGEDIGIHYHTFTPASLREVLEIAGLAGDASACFEIVSQGERYPPNRGDGCAFVLRKKTIGDSPTPTTLTLSHPQFTGTTLPVVCPVSLRPLQHRTTRGEAHLIEPKSGRVYSFDGGTPVLLPGDLRMPRRRWRHTSSRVLQYLTSLPRLFRHRGISPSMS